MNKVLKSKGFLVIMMLLLILIMGGCATVADFKALENRVTVVEKKNKQQDIEIEGIEKAMKSFATKDELTSVDKRISTLEKNFRDVMKNTKDIERLSESISSISSDLKLVSIKLDAMRERIDTFSKVASSLSDYDPSLPLKVKDLKKRIDVMKGILDSLNSQNKSYYSHISAFEAKLTENASLIRSNKMAIETNIDTIPKLESSITHLSSRINELKDAVDTIKTDKSIENLQNLISQIESEVNKNSEDKYKIEKIIDSMNKDIMRIKSNYVKLIVSLATEGKTPPGVDHQRPSEVNLSEDIEHFVQLQSDFNNLKEKVDNLDNTLKSTGKEIQSISTLRSELTSTTKEIERLNQRFSSYAALLSSFKNFHAVLESSNFTSLQDVVNQLQKINSLEEKIASLNNKITQFDATSHLPDRVVELVGFDIRKFKDELSNYKNSINMSVDNVEKKITLLEANLKAKTDFSNQAENLENVKRAIEKLWKRTNQIESAFSEYNVSRLLKTSSGYIIYKVKTGDVLSKIVEAFGLGTEGMKEVQRLNNISDPSKIYAGQELKIPVTDISNLITWPLSPVNRESLRSVMHFFGELIGVKTSVGVDIKSRNDQKVVAVLPGKVIDLGENTAYGRYVKLGHGNSIVTIYSHLRNIYVHFGEWVRKGEQIGYAGVENGIRFLNFQLWIDDEPKDPLKIFYKYIGEFDITFYTEWDDGKVPLQADFKKTKSGQYVEEWYTVAADPKIIPLGSVLYIPYFKDKPNRGFFIVTDIGTAIKDNRIDIYVRDLDEANQKLKLKVYKVHS